VLGLLGYTSSAAPRYGSHRTMPNLRNFERRLGDIVEGFFGKAFKSGLQPVELGKRIVREMEAGRTVGVNNVWVPNSYVFTLSEEDREHFSQIEGALAKELQGVVVEAARERGWGLLGPPEVTFETDAELGRGQFRCEAQLVQAEDVKSGEHTAYLPASGEMAAVAAGKGELVLLEDGKPVTTYPIDRDTLTIGRMAECDIVLTDPGASRKHAEIRRDGDRVVVADLGSTNGTLVNESTIDERELEEGDRITIGRTVLEFRRG
jgi:FHA domain-containing protein